MLVATVPALVFDRKVAALVDPITQILARLEMRYIFARQCDCLTGFWIAADSRRPKVQGKAAETANFNSPSVRERIAHEIKQVLDGQFDILCRQVLLLACDNFYEFRFGHLSLRLYELARNLRIIQAI